MLKKIKACLELMRPANIVTAFADILAGFAAAGGVFLFTTNDLADPSGLIWLLIATFGLYGGGIVFNDVFDADLDAQERPERAIPSGRITRKEASAFGGILFIIAIIAAFQVSSAAVGLSLFIIFASLIYDSRAKHSVILGPLFMGLCRGGNIMLGASVYPDMFMNIWFLALIPVIYISAITLISRGEVAGGDKKHGYLALFMILVVVSGIPLLSFLPTFDLLTASPALIFFGVMVIPAFATAAKTSEAEDIRKAVKRGVVSLVIYNSVLVFGFSGFFPGVITLGLFPLSIGISHYFKVT